MLAIVSIKALRLCSTICRYFYNRERLRSKERRTEEKEGKVNCPPADENSNCGQIDEPLENNSSTI
jgi:hypothetical protein